MTTTALSTALATIQPAFTDPERLGPRRLPGRVPRADPRGVRAGPAPVHQLVPHPLLPLFAVRRAHIEGFARELEARGRARATVTRRLSTIAGFYKYAVEEELLDHSPAARLRRPRLDYESHATALDRNELGALLVAAGLGPPLEHALISLLALNGLRVSEATGADVEHLDLERGHRTLTITRKGGKIVTIPLAPRTARAIDLATGERCDGPIFLTHDGRRLDRHGAGRIVREVARRAGISKTVGPHTLRHAFITAAQGRGVASDATFRAWREDGVAGAAALSGACLARGPAAGHAVDQGFLAPGCGGCQDVASESVALDDRWLHLASRAEGAVWGQCGGRWRWWLPMARCRFRPAPHCWRRCWPGGAVSSRRAG